MGATDAEIAQAPRWRTAQAADALVAGLVGKDATAALKHLAQAKLDTSAAAMRRAWGRPPGCSPPSTSRRNGRRSTWWPRSTASDTIQAEDLLADLKNALTSDEYAVALEPHLDSALTQAIRLLRPKSSAITRLRYRHTCVRPTGGRRSSRGRIRSRRALGGRRSRSSRPSWATGRRRQARNPLEPPEEGATLMSAVPVTAHQVRSKVAWVLQKEPDALVIGLHAAGPWQGDGELDLGERRFAVVRADTVLEVREALADAETLSAARPWC